MDIRALGADRLDLIGAIDRSERITAAYAVEHGELVTRDVDWHIPNWDPTGSGEHSVAVRIDFCRPILDRGGILLGSFDGGEVQGLSVVEPEFEGTMAWLAFLHVSRPHRRRGVASALWDESIRLARDSGADRMYVSAAPTESAVGFYLRKGCVLASTPHPDLLADEPADIHLIFPMGRAPIAGI